SGATIVGTVRPRDIAEVVHGSRAPLPSDSFLPGIVFLREDQAFDRWPPMASSVPAIAVEPDGSFVARGLPPGSWNLHLVYEPERRASYRYRLAGTAYAKVGGYPPLAVVKGLREGETRHLDLDASDRIPARLHGRVFVDGE